MENQTNQSVDYIGVGSGVVVIFMAIGVCVGVPMMENERIAKERIEAQHMVP